MENKFKMKYKKLGTLEEKTGLNNGIQHHSDTEDGAYSVDDAVNSAGFGKFQIMLLCLAGLGWTLDGFETIFLTLIGDFIACDWFLLRWQNAFLTSAVFLGVMFGSPVLGAIADIYGRKKSILISMILVFIFGLSSSMSPSFIWLLIFRCCMGFALGGMSQGITLCSEYFPSDTRGRAGFFLGYFWTFGAICIILLSWLIMENLNSWRILAVAASIPALISIISIKWYPESARYFLISNQHDRALKSLEKMASMNGQELPSGQLVEIAEVSKRGRIIDLLRQKYRRVTLLFWYIWLASAFTYYGVALISPIIIRKGFLRAEVSKDNVTLNTMDDFQTFAPCAEYTRTDYINLIWITAAEIPGYIIFTFLVERCNRKVLLGYSCLLSGFLILGILIKSEYKFIVLMFLFGARALISSIFQLTYVMTIEAFPTPVRAIALGSSSSFSRLGGIFVPYLAQIIILDNPVSTMATLAVIIILAGLATYYLPLDTKGRHLVETLN